MADTYKTGIFYGYKTKPNEEKQQHSELKKLAEQAGLELIKTDGGETILGKKIEQIRSPGTKNITASELLKKITQINKTPSLQKLETKLELENQKPTLIITGRKTRQ